MSGRCCNSTYAFSLPQKKKDPCNPKYIIMVTIIISFAAGLPVCIKTSLDYYNYWQK